MYRLYANPNKIRFSISPLSAELHSITGLHADDYHPTVLLPGQIMDILSDESSSSNGDYFTVALVLMPFYSRDILHEISNKLKVVCVKYGMKNIHFDDIFGRNNILREQIDDFIDEYVDATSPIIKNCISCSVSKRSLIENNGFSKNCSYETIYNSLFWLNFKRLSAVIPKGSIIHIFMEQDRSLERFENSTAIREFDKLYSGLYGCPEIKNYGHHVCKHPHITTKVDDVLHSSLADLAAYSSNKIQGKIDAGVPINKIGRRYSRILKLLKRTFYNYSGFGSAELERLIKDADSKAASAYDQFLPWIQLRT